MTYRISNNYRFEKRNKMCHK